MGEKIRNSLDQSDILFGKIGAYPSKPVAETHLAAAIANVEPQPGKQVISQLHRVKTLVDNLEENEI